MAADIRMVGSRKCERGLFVQRTMPECGANVRLFVSAWVFMGAFHLCITGWSCTKPLWIYCGHDADYESHGYKRMYRDLSVVACFHSFLFRE